MDDRDLLVTFLEEYEAYLERSFAEIWRQVPIDPLEPEISSVIGALVARQVTLSKELSGAPSCWNGHSAPLFLRAQTDLHITLAWILINPSERARKFIAHGLGEVKVLIEHYRNMSGENEFGEQVELMIELRKNWIDSQRHEFLVNVDFSNWSALTVRQMALEANCEDLYNYAYKPFSHAAHSMWPHVSVYNSRVCGNPLHKYHLIPEIGVQGADLDYLYRSCKYVDKGYRALINKFGLKVSCSMPLEWWQAFFETLDSSESQNNLGA